MSFKVNNVTDDDKKANIVLTHIPTKYFDDVLALSSPTPIEELSLNDIKSKLDRLFKKEKNIVKALMITGNK